MFRTPKEAEAAFYAALENADLDTMMDVWADDHNIACVHPMGPRLEGQAEITDSWRRIFNGGARMRFRISDVQALTQGDVAVHVVHENITVANRSGESTVLATNVYRLVDGSWYMVLHHASPAPNPQEIDEEPDEDSLEDEEEDEQKVLH